MSAETPGNQHDPTATSAEAVKSSPFTPNDIPELSDAERQDPAIKQACDEFCRRFEDFDDPMIVREAIRKADPEITKDELFHDMDRLEAAARKHLPPIADVSSVEQTTKNEATETPEARKARLGKFVETHFADICPTERRDLAVNECAGFEDRCREMWEDPTLVLTDEDAQDPNLRKTIEEKISLTIEIATNNETIAEITADRDREAATRDETTAERDRTTEEREAVTAERTALEKDVAHRETISEKADEREEIAADRNEIATADLTTMQQLQDKFAEVKAQNNGSTLEALRTLLGDEGVKTTELRAKVHQILGQLEQVSDLGSTEAAKTFFRQTVDSATPNFTATASAQMHASLLSQIDQGLASGAITKQDADSARVMLGVPPKAPSEPYKLPDDPKQMARELRDRRNVERQVPKIDPATGEPMRDSEGNIIYETITEENNDIIPIDHPHLKIYLKPEPGTDAYYVHVHRASRTPLVERIDADNFAMGGMREINYLVATADLEQQGYTDIFGSQFTDNEVRRDNFQNFARATGLRTDFGSLWTTEHSDRVHQIMQMLHPRGDLGRDDVNPDNWKSYASELGIFNAQTNQWDYDALRLWRDSKIYNTVGKDGEALRRSGEIDFDSTRNEAA